jgi:hypothetical protein
MRGERKANLSWSIAMLPLVRPSRALPAPVSRTLSFLLSLQPSTLSGVEHAPADLFEYPTPTATGSAYQSASTPAQWTRCVLLALPSRHTNAAIVLSLLASLYSLRRLAAHASGGVR